MNTLEALFLCFMCFGMGIEVGLSEWFPRLVRVRVFRLSDWKLFWRGGTPGKGAAGK